MCAKGMRGTELTNGSAHTCSSVFDRDPPYVTKRVLRGTIHWISDELCLELDLIRLFLLVLPCLPVHACYLDCLDCILSNEYDYITAH